MNKKQNQPISNDTAGTGDVTSSNAYVAVLNKKIRNLTKKLDKIEKIERNMKEGKTINEDQEKVLSSKKNVESQVADYKNIRDSLVKIAAEESKAVPVVETVTVEVGTEPSPTKEASTEASPETTNVGTDTESPVIPSAVSLKILLGAFHIMLNDPSRVMQGCVNNSAFDYLYNYLSGKESTQGFSETLDTAVENATALLSKSTDASIAGISYSELSEYIEELLVKETEVAVEVVEEAVVEVEVVEETVAEFNFMGDSKLEPETKALWGDIVSPAVPATRSAKMEPSDVVVLPSHFDDVVPTSTIAKSDTEPVVEAASVTNAALATPAPAVAPKPRLPAWGNNNPSGDLIRKAPTKPVAQRKPAPAPLPTANGDEKKTAPKGGRRGGRNGGRNRRGSKNNSGKQQENKGGNEGGGFRRRNNRSKPDSNGATASKKA
jgi:hypothetical protein